MGLEKKKKCPRCGKELHPLGYARHMAMHRDADELLEKYRGSKNDKTV